MAAKPRPPIDVKTPHSQSRRSASLAHLLTIATLIQAFATASALAFTGIAPLVAGEAGLNAHWIGYQISLIYTAGMVSSAIAGTLIAQLGASRIEQLAILCAALGFLGFATGHLTVIIAASIIIGFGYGLNNPAASQLLSQVTPARQRNLIFSIKQSGVPIGGIMASAAFPLIAEKLGWRAGLLIGAVFSLVLCLWLAIGHREGGTKTTSTRSFISDLIEAQSLIWKRAPLRCLSLIGLLYSAMQLSMSAFAVLSLVEYAGWSLLSAGAVAAAMQFAGALGRIFWGMVADRLGGGLATLGIIGLIMAGCCVLLYWITALPVAVQILLFIVMGVSSIGWNGVLLAEIANHASAGEVGKLTGAVLVYVFVGVMIGPSSFGILYAAFGNYGAAYLGFASTGLVGAMLCLFQILSNRAAADMPKASGST